MEVVIKSKTENCLQDEYESDPDENMEGFISVKIIHIQSSLSLKEIEQQAAEMAGPQLISTHINLISSMMCKSPFGRLINNMS